MTVEQVPGGKTFELTSQKASRKYVKLATTYTIFGRKTFVNSLVLESGKLILLSPDSSVTLCE